MAWRAQRLANHPTVADEFFTPIWNQSSGVWLVITPYAGISDPNDNLVNWLADQVVTVFQFPYGDKALHFYPRTEERQTAVTRLADSFIPRQMLTADLGNAQLTGYDQVLRDAAGGDTVTLFLYTNGTESNFIEVGLMDETGQVWQETAITLTPPRQQVDILISPRQPRWKIQELCPGWME